MDSRFNSPAEIASLVSKSGVTKSMLSLPKMILLGLMAGAFIAFGGAASDVAMHGVADVGLRKEKAIRDFAVEKTGLNPAAFQTVILDSIPKNDAGKTLYRELEKYYSQV